MSNKTKTRQNQALNGKDHDYVDTETIENAFVNKKNEQNAVVDNRKTKPVETAQPKRTSFFQFLEGRDSRENIVFEPLIQNPYNLSYTCLLIPRFPNHYLIGDIVMGLNDRMTQISVAYGWRLDYISIKSDYLQWVLSVPPATSTGRFINLVRQQTSSYIFEDFPRFKRVNPSGDFWAPGYLINAGSQPHPQDAIKQFIKETRRQQGLY